MLPKIIFKHSYIYSKNIAYWQKKDISEKGLEKLKQHKDKLERVFKKEGKKILPAIERASGLKWHQNEIACYIVKNSFSFSDPLTIGFEKGPKKIEYYVDVLTHELIHQILTEKENWLKIEKNWNKLMRKYKKYSWRTKVHVIVHAIHAEVLKSIFNEKRLQSEIKNTKSPDYIKAWEVVLMDGSKNIIKELLK